MCGILGCLNATYPDEIIHTALDNLSARGPDKKTMYVDENCVLGFTRLAINGVENGEQPFTLDASLTTTSTDAKPAYILICNGEIYNYRELYQYVETTPNTHSDCEVILHMYAKYGIHRTLELLHGVYAFILYDKTQESIYIARDPFGVRPLYRQNNLFASEMKGITPFQQTHAITPFPPATCEEYRLIRHPHQTSVSEWCLMEVFQHYHLPPFRQTISTSIDELYTQIVKSLYDAVKRRVDTTERPIACLLSGGLDSSLITAMTAHILRKQGRQLKTFSIGMEDGEDLRYARMVAGHIQSDHHEIIMSEKEFLEVIPDVIYATETFDTTTVRASVGNYLVAKYIREHTDCKVVMNGDGSDEVCGGYMYFHYAPDSIAFDAECRRLLRDIHMFDVLRSDRSIASNGLEARTPFLDRDFVSMYLSIPAHIRNHCINHKCEKYLLRTAFQVEWRDLLPREVLWRTKEAFSDGVSKQTRSWYEIIQEYIEKEGIYVNENKRQITTYTTPRPTTKEQKWYKQLWRLSYPSYARPIEYYWMPRFVDAVDASARTLANYKSRVEKEIQE